MYQIVEIGQISRKHNNIVIQVEEKYKKALKQLEHFSHAHIFYLGTQTEEWYVAKKIIHMQSVDLKAGTIVAEEDWDLPLELRLIDIKPYFPCEDTVKEIKREEPYDIRPSILVDRNDSDGKFYVNPIGMIRKVQGDVFIQFEKMPVVMNEYIKVYWWFHKFDSKQYRKVTECNPPYENAPRSGVFATRSPVRPNPIAMTVAKVGKVDREGKRIYINGIESFDQTPCIGISSYCPETDRVLDCKVPEWLKHWPEWIDEKEEDQNQEEMECHDSILVDLLEKDTVLVMRNIRALEENEKDRMVSHDEIIVRGARENNLRAINVRIPYGKITAVVGVSGSGKSSLVNDTIYAECRRRMEYLGRSRNLLQKPRVENIIGCIPAVIISQDAIRGNSLSTVGTYTNAYDYLRMIYASIAIQHCPDCGNEIIPLSKERILTLLEHQNVAEVYDLAKRKISTGTLEEQVDEALAKGNGAFYCETEGNEFLLLQTKLKCYRCNKLLFNMTPQTFSYIDSDSRCPICHGTGKTVEIDEKKIIPYPERSLLDGASSFYGKLRTFIERPNANWMKGQVFGLAEELQEELETPWEELSDEFRNQFLYGTDKKEVTFSYVNKKNGRNGQITRPVEGVCQIITRMYQENGESRLFDKYMTKVTCKYCQGERLNKEGRMATIQKVRYPLAAKMTFHEIYEFCNTLERTLSSEAENKVHVAILSLKEIAESAVKLGIGYLRLSQETSTLSAGEGQRMKLLGAYINHMSGILYIFDEPSKGLHPKDYGKVIDMMKCLQREGNTLIMVEHNEDMIRCAEYIIELGPGAGKQGGQVVGEGRLDDMQQNTKTQLSRYMGKRNAMENPYGNPYGNPRREQKKQEGKTNQFIRMENLCYRNLKSIAIQFPKNALTCICGVSGSGKSSLMTGEIYPRLSKSKEFLEAVLVDQSPIGKNSKSIVATYIGIMDWIREAFAATDMAVERLFDEKYFSFNGELGQCETCKGEGRIKVKYLEDAYQDCPDCKGKRYQKKILEVKFKGKHINEILTMSIEEALSFWKESELISQKLMALQKVGLGYLTLGQNTSSLSGGEASRLKLAKELISDKKNNILYLLDEPTTGLHFSDISHMLCLISELVQNGNTVIAIEHNKQFLASCDWVIELGPGAGEDGGEVVRQGSLSVLNS